MRLQKACRRSDRDVRAGETDMWWLYVKAEETENLIVYHYSTETRDLDGKIVYNKRAEEWEVTRPCARDQGSAWCIDKSEGKFRHVADEGFPDRRMVAIG